MTTSIRQPESALAYASCYMYSDSLDPPFWTRYFGVEPDSAFMKGQRFKTPSGRMSRMPGRTGVWRYSSRDRLHADDIDPHISFLISSLALPRPELPALLRSKDVRMVISCFWYHELGELHQAVVGADLRRIIEISGGVIDIDECGPD